MKRKGFSATLFFGVIVALLLGFTIFDFWSGDKKEQKKDDASKVVQFKKDDITQIHITGAGGERKFAKKDGKWQITYPLQETADQQEVLSSLDALLAERVSETVKDETGTGDFHLETYGLHQPLFDLKLTAGLATSDLKIGAIKAFDGSLYGQINDQKKVVLLSSAWDVILSKPIKDFRDKRLYRGDPGLKFTSVTVSGRDADGSFQYELDRDQEKNEWALKSARATDPIITENVEAWLSQIQNLKGAEFEVPPPTAPAFQADVMVTLTRKDLEPFVLKIARDEKNFELFEATSTDLPQKFDSRVVLSKGSAEAVMLRSSAFFDRKAPFAFDLKKVARLVFSDAKTGKKLDTAVDPAHPDVLLAKLPVLEAVRFLGFASKSNENKFPSSLRLLSSDGGLVFEMSWGDPVVEKATADRPEASYLPVRTNLSKQVVGVAEKLIRDLSKGN